MEDFIKQTIVDAFATSSKMRDDANIKITKKIESKVGKQVSMVTVEL